jgi:hypothetical protein
VMHPPSNHETPRPPRVNREHRANNTGAQIIRHLRHQQHPRLGAHWLSRHYHTMLVLARDRRHGQQHTRPCTLSRTAADAAATRPGLALGSARDLLRRFLSEARRTSNRRPCNHAAADKRDDDHATGWLLSFMVSRMDRVFNGRPHARAHGRPTLSDHAPRRPRRTPHTRLPDRTDRRARDTQTRRQTCMGDGCHRH